MGILERYEEIMALDFSPSIETLSQITDEVNYYISLGQQIRQHQKDYAQAHRELNVVLERELDCKRILDAATDEANKYNAMISKAKNTSGMSPSKSVLCQKQKSAAVQKAARADYDAAVADTKKMHELCDKLSANIYDLKVLRNYIRDKSFGGVIH